MPHWARAILCVPGPVGPGNRSAAPGFRAADGPAARSSQPTPCAGALPLCRIERPGAPVARM